MFFSTYFAVEIMYRFAVAASKSSQLDLTKPLPALLFTTQKISVSDTDHLFFFWPGDLLWREL